MPKLRVLSGKDILAILKSFGFEVVKQKGSHIKLQRLSLVGDHQTLTIPNHKILDRGTLHAIYRQSSRYISESELYGHFYIVSQKDP